MERNGSSEEDVDVNTITIYPLAEDHELKGQLLRKYSGYLGSLKQEFMKKRKKGKLPNAMQTPYRSYLQEMLTLVKRERAEREALGALPLYQRTLP